jgi:hypothetical protein
MHVCMYVCMYVYSMSERLSVRARFLRAHVHAVTVENRAQRDHETNKASQTRMTDASPEEERLQGADQVRD